mmetsp:Transcript_20561/g.41160  ORF Transcript_20561/g.41160 Transcript_20561/m.41160 type:complete len:258 (+) Transcript_20561:150-923(+)
MMPGIRRWSAGSERRRRRFGADPCPFSSSSCRWRAQRTARCSASRAETAPPPRCSSHPDPRATRLPPFGASLPPTATTPPPPPPPTTAGRVGRVWASSPPTSSRAPAARRKAPGTRSSASATSAAIRTCTGCPPTCRSCFPSGRGRGSRRRRRASPRPWRRRGCGRSARPSTGSARYARTTPRTRWCWSRTAGAPRRSPWCRRRSRRRCAGGTAAGPRGMAGAGRSSSSGGSRRTDRRSKCSRCSGAAPPGIPFRSR